MSETIVNSDVLCLISALLLNCQHGDIWGKVLQMLAVVSHYNLHQCQLCTSEWTMSVGIWTLKMLQLQHQFKHYGEDVIVLCSFLLTLAFGFPSCHVYHILSMCHPLQGIMILQEGMTR